jgi:hypothetical protein
MSVSDSNLQGALFGYGSGVSGEVGALQYYSKEVVDYMARFYDTATPKNSSGLGLS